MTDITKKYLDKIDPELLKQYKTLNDNVASLKKELEDLYQYHTEQYLKTKENDANYKLYRGQMRTLLMELESASNHEELLNDFEQLEAKYLAVQADNEKVLVNDKICLDKIEVKEKELKRNLDELEKIKVK